MRIPTPDSLLAGPLGTILASHEDERRNARRKSWLRLLIAGPIAIAAFLYGVFGFDGDLAGKMIAGGVAALGVFRWTQSPKRHVSEAVKSDINSAIAQAMDLEYSAEVEPGWSFEWAEYFAMLPNYDEAEFEDLWQGDYNGFQFTLHEALLKEWRQSGKNERLTTVFHGSIFSFETHAEFKGTTLFRKKRAAQDWMAGKFLSKQRRPEDVGLGKVELPISEFSQKFDCFSDFKDESLRLMTSKLQEYLLKMEAEDPKAPLYALFHEEQFLLVAPSGDMFESGTAKASMDREMIAATIEQFKFIANISAAV